jgi:hypothetical protein
MSTSILKIIPTNSTFVPEKNQQEKAKDFLIELYKDKEIEVFVTDSVQFIDQGENFDNVLCNLCGQNIEIEDWQNAMNEAYEKEFTDLGFISLCCGKKTSLNDLAYEMPAGFAKFVITVSDPVDEIEEEKLNELQQILETKLKIIWAHY